MQLEDFKKGLFELSPDELSELLRDIRTSRTKPKASNKKRKEVAERAVKAGRKAPSKNQVLNLINGLSDEDAAKLLAAMTGDDA